MSTVEQPKSKLKVLPISSIRENPEALRKVDKKRPEYAEFVDSIRKHGVMNPITVREQRDPNTNELLYGLVDGLHRYTGSMDAGLQSIPAHVLNLKEAETAVAQIVANIHRVETKAVEYSKQLERILKMNPLMTMSDLAGMVNKSEQWLRDRLSLVNLPDNIAQLINDNKIVLSNAYCLVDLHKVAPDEVNNFLDRAQTMAPPEFASNISVRVKEIKQARRQGREETKANEFSPAPFLQKTAAIKEEYENAAKMPEVLAAMNAKTAEEGWKAFAAWALHMDPISIEEGRKKFEDHKAAQEAERAARKEEREKEKLAKAAKSTVDATETNRPNVDNFVNTLAATTNE